MARSLPVTWDKVLHLGKAAYIRRARKSADHKHSSLFYLSVRVVDVQFYNVDAIFLNLNKIKTFLKTSDSTHYFC
jgi:hypothetical protein